MTSRRERPEEFGSPPTEHDLVLIENGDNLGYAGGNNVALRRATKWNYDWALVLNNDTTVPPDLLPQLAATAESRPRVGMVSCRIASGDARRYPPYEGGMLRYRLGVHWLKRWHGRNGNQEVNFVPGCAAFLSVTMLRDIGLFDERFFLYSEDVDLSYRAARAGWSLLLNLDTTVDHALAASSGGYRNPVYYYYVTRNTWLFIQDRLPGVSRWMSFLFFGLQTAARMVIWALSGRRGHMRAVRYGCRDFLRRRFGPAPAEVASIGSAGSR